MALRIYNDGPRLLKVGGALGATCHPPSLTHTRADARRAVTRGVRRAGSSNCCSLLHAFTRNLLFAQQAEHFGALLRLLRRFELVTLPLPAVQHGAFALGGARDELKDGEHRAVVRAERALVRRCVEARRELPPRAEENAIAPCRQAHLASFPLIVPRGVGARKVPVGAERRDGWGGRAGGAFGAGERVSGVRVSARARGEARGEEKRSR